MVHLLTSRNIVFLSKKESQWQDFVRQYLIKYEEVTKLDYMNSSRDRKKFKFVKERRDLYTENTDFIIFSRGILELIPSSEYEREELVSDSLVEPRLTYEEIKTTLDSFDLRDDQVIAVSKALKVHRGVIQLPTAVGKSAIITTIIKRLQEVNPDMKSLVLAPTLSTVKNINDTLEEAGIDTAIYGHPNKEINTHTTAALVQSLLAVKDDHLLEDINAVFYDECLPSKSKILLPDHQYKSIADIYEDESINEVVAFDINSQQYVTRKILRKFRTPFNSRFCRVYYKDISGTSGITCTLNHKIYTQELGYLSAEELEPGLHIKVHYNLLSQVFNFATYREVVRVSPNIGSKAEYKYNLEVEGTHNYFADNVLVSNCHHLKCDTWNKLNTLLPNVEYALGFSALSIDKKEIYKTDFKDLSYNASLIIGSSGRVLLHMDPSYYIQKGIIALPAVMRIKSTITFPEGFDESKWHEVVKQGVMSTPRTVALTKVASMFNQYNRKVLILVPEKEYAFRIGEYLVKQGVTNYGISFGAGVGYLYDSSYEDEDGSLKINYVDEDSLEVLEGLSTNKINILIGSSHLDEGVNISKLDACILTCGGKTDRRIVQRLGRVLRKSKSGKYAYIIDFTDDGSIVLSRQSKKRLKMYREEIGVPEDTLFDRIDLSEVEDKFLELEGLNKDTEATYC